MQSKGVLENGDRKYLLTDHIRLRPGTGDEVAIVRWIFQEFLQRKSETAIVRKLNREAIPTSTGQPWNRGLIGRLLRNENYIGNLVFNRRSCKLRDKNVYNQPDVWIRSENCIEPIIERTVFLRARKIIEERRVDLPEGEMLARLRRTLMKERRLSPAIIDRTAGLPCTATYMQQRRTPSPRQAKSRRARSQARFILLRAFRLPLKFGSWKVSCIRLASRQEASKRGLHRLKTTLFCSHRSSQSNRIRFITSARPRWKTCFIGSLAMRV